MILIFSALQTIQFYNKKMTSDTKESLLDALISDLKPKICTKQYRIDLKSNTFRLSSSTQELDDVKGIMFGKASRLVGLLTMKVNRDVKNVYFLTDTGSLETAVCEEVLKSYN